MAKYIRYIHLKQLAMVRITPDETKNYRLLDHEYFSHRGMREAIAYTLTQIGRAHV